MNWSTKTIGELCDQSNGIVQTGPFGSQLKQSEYIDDVDGVPVVMPKDIKVGSIDESEIARISESKAISLNRHMLAAGDIVFPRRGEIGKRGYIKETGKYFCGTGCLKIHMPDNEVLNKYLFYYLDQDHVVKWLEGRAIGSTMLNLNTSIMRSVNINFPDLQSQERIVSTLSAYDDLIENNKRRIELLEESARQLYKEWFVRFRFPGHEHVKIIDGVPKGWLCEELEKYAEVRNGFAFKSDDYSTEGMPLVRTRDFSSTKYIVRDEAIFIPATLIEKFKNYQLNRFDFLLIMVGASLGKFGVVMSKDLPSLQNQNMWAIYTKNNQKFPQVFLIELMQELINKFINYRVGAAREFFRKDFVKKQKVLIPPENLLSNFSEVVERLYNQIENILHQNEKLAEARDILLPRLMSGEIAV